MMWRDTPDLAIATRVPLPDHSTGAPKPRIAVPSLPVVSHFLDQEPDGLGLLAENVG